MAIGFDALNVGATICDNGHLRKQDFDKFENALGDTLRQINLQTHLVSPAAFLTLAPQPPGRSGRQYQIRPFIASRQFSLPLGHGGRLGLASRPAPSRFPPLGFSPLALRRSRACWARLDRRSSSLGLSIFY
jgi:hypothetical protein